MQKRRELLFSGKEKPPGSKVIPATVSFKIDKKQGRLQSRSAEDKMKIALRKILGEMGDRDQDGCRFYILNNEIEVTRGPTSSDGRPGEARTYKAAGRCAIGVCLPEGRRATKKIAYDITFRDVKDERGLDDVDWIDPSMIEEIPKRTRIG